MLTLPAEDTGLAGLLAREASAAGNRLVGYVLIAEFADDEDARWVTTGANVPPWTASGMVMHVLENNLLDTRCDCEEDDA